ncbi:response regulator transcription factor [Wukongibacter sp. M2B1]|uniref:response regulator transcription factor n=1 Tax=Wukongibacter sp. M2B1 TaxID=3088895 RepID=UPI003D7BBDE5
MCKVLLVDDEYLERHALKIIISEGIEGTRIVGEAGSGRQALELCEKTDPDIIFMDIKMPGMNGIEATEIIKNRDEDKIVIILTAYDEFVLAQRAIKAKADDYILKPARSEVILETMKRHIGNIKSKRSLSDQDIQNLVRKIRCGDFKGAKEKLKELLSRLDGDNSFDNRELTAPLKKIVNGMLDVSNKLGLKSRSISDSEFNSKVSSMTDIYQIEIWLLQILDEIFGEIMEKKICYSDNYLFLALNYIEKNYHRGVTLEDVADYVNLSTSYLSKLFKKELNINISKYITGRRVERAKEILENTDMPVLNIAVDLGYNESNYFSKVFKKVVGMTPSEYRNKKRVEKEKALKSNLMTRHIPISNGKWQI